MNEMKQSLYGLLLPILLLLLSGCGQDNSDLHAYIKEVNNRKAGRIEPIPELFVKPHTERKIKRDIFAPLKTE